jgi:sulfur-carrier protein adenylyltransferase/sulfurtransferase
MPVTLLIPSALRSHTNGAARVEVPTATVSAALAVLAGQFPSLRPHLFADNGALRRFVNVYVNDEDVRFLNGLDTVLKDGDQIALVPAVAGGRPSQESGGIDLTPEEMTRYSRHIALPEVGMEGQKKLKAARVLCIGAGGLGSPISMYLAAAGIGRIGLVDFDAVDLSNLQRQILHGIRDVGRSKIESATDTLKAINPHVEVEPHPVRLTSANALEILRPFDVVVDGSDNFATRYLVNDACVLLGKPNVHGSVFQFEGQTSVFFATRGPCYRCLYPEPPPPGMVPSCATGGVLGILPGVIGLIQATETVKLVLGLGDTLIGRLLIYDALGMTFREVKLRKDPACPLCGTSPTIRTLIDYEQFCGAGETSTAGEVSPEELKARLDRRERIVLLDVREPHEAEICRLPRSLLIPLGSLEDRVGELDQSNTIIAYCRTGGRSAKAVRWLRKHGFPRVENLAGGIMAWAERVDPSMAKY